MFEKLFQLPMLAKYAAANKKWLDLLEFDIRNVDVSKEKISCTISFPEKLTGNDGIVHGGITCFVIDSVAGIFSMILNSDSTQKALTKNLSVSFLKPITPNTVYSIETVHSDKNIQVTITDSDNNQMAIGQVEIVFK